VTGAVIAVNSENSMKFGPKHAEGEVVDAAAVSEPKVEQVLQVVEVVESSVTVPVDVAPMYIEV